MLVLDSGLGGLSVVRALRTLAPELRCDYLADTAGFPYGSRGVDDLQEHAHILMQQVIDTLAPSVIVLACNTLSTLCLESLRAAFSVPFVGTVPAIKVAASLSKTRRFTLLSTPNTAASSYTDDLVSRFAADCVVDRYGAPNLARYAEAVLLGEAVSDDAIAAEVAPCFYDDAHGKTDAIILGCTHYPLLAEQLARSAPWHAAWIDSSDAIARRALSQMQGAGGQGNAYVTGEAQITRYRPVFAAEGFEDTRVLANALCHI